MARSDEFCESESQHHEQSLVNAEVLRTVIKNGLLGGFGIRSEIFFDLRRFFP